MRRGWTRHDRVMFGLAVVNLSVAVWWLATGDFLVGWVMLMFAATMTVHQWHLRSTHNNAWMMGRMAMVTSMGEAIHRGMPVEDWARAEAERDLGRRLW